ncbi:MAG: ABC transporter ATP-binding protein [Rhizobiaceae bacterium]|nr:ABC transporter ATP-binding protein [Rhizobiaceae bacterium]
MILSARDISVSFGGFTAVDGAGIDVAEGAVVGLVGPNGAGKSSLFGAITGYLPASGGTVSLDGVDISRLPAYGRVRRGLGRTFQVPREFTHLSVRDNLSAAVPEQSGETLLKLFGSPSAVRKDEARVRRKVDEVLEIVGLGHVQDLHGGSLSGGQRKLLELGRVLLTDPRVVLLDEPFGGVNPVMIERLSEVIKSLNDRGVAFLIVEHNLAALSRLVGRLYVMDRGKVIAEGAPADVLSLPAVQDAYLGTVA